MQSELHMEVDFPTWSELHMGVDEVDFPTWSELHMGVDEVDFTTCK